MYQQTGLFFYKFRFLVAGIVIAAFLMAVSALVTSIGSNTVLNPKFHSAASVSSASDSPNILTSGSYVLEAGLQRAALSVGTGLYGACRSVTMATASTGKGIAHGSAAIVGGMWHGTTFVARGIGSATMFTFHTAGSAVTFTVHLPGKAVRPITNVHAVSAIIQPTDNVKPVPIISAETSAQAIARLSAVQQQEIAKLQAAQLAANQALNGAIVAGDPAHGGYPARWDNRAQDSTFDSWGMYNRECVSYAAWKVYQTYGHMPYWGGVGNANEWPRDARRGGIPTSSIPQVHSVAISMRGYYGHAMWVEAVRGNMIYVSQYNYDLHGHYSEMWVNGSYFTYIYFR